MQEKASATFVGFANLPNQVFRKAVKRGFQFSLMVVGKRASYIYPPLIIIPYLLLTLVIIELFI